VRRKILLALALPVAASAVRTVATQLEKRGHDQAGARAQKAADLLRPGKKRVAPQR